LCAWLQATQLPCFEALIDHLGRITVDEAEMLMLHQLFQALMMSRLEAQRQNAPDVAQRIPERTLSLITRCTLLSGGLSLVLVRHLHGVLTAGG
jgi:hypothetical protein